MKSFTLVSNLPLMIVVALGMTLKASWPHAPYL